MLSFSTQATGPLGEGACPKMVSYASASKTHTGVVVVVVAVVVVVTVDVEADVSLRYTYRQPWQVISQY